MRRPSSASLASWDRELARHALALSENRALAVELVAEVAWPILHRLGKGEADIPTIVRAIYIGLDPRLEVALSTTVIKESERSVAFHRALVAATGRRVIEAAGYGESFVHRTGHSIDRDLHGSGPHLDDYETHDDRRLLPGVGFSVEPGIYLPGAFGIRSEVNVFMGSGGPEVTPREPQVEMITS